MQTLDGANIHVGIQRPLAVEALFRQLDNGAIVTGHGPIGTEMSGGYPVEIPEIGFHNAADSEIGRGQLRDVHDAYTPNVEVVEAGTWGPSPRALLGLEFETAVRIKAHEHRIAQESADAAYKQDGVPRVVLDTVRPVDDCYEPILVPTTLEGQEEKYRELYNLHRLQAEVYARAGSGGVLLQTFPSLLEIRAAIDAFTDAKVPVLGVSAYVIKVGGSNEVELPGSITPDGTRQGDSLAELAALAEGLDILVGIGCVSPLVGAPAAEQLIRQSSGKLKFYVGLNGLSHDAHDTTHRGRSDAELAEEAARPDNRFELRKAYRAIVRMVVEANRRYEAGGINRRVGAVIAACCFTNPSTIAEIGWIIEEAFSDDLASVGGGQTLGSR